MIPRIATILVLTFALATASSAQDTPAVHPDINAVESGGYWSSGSRHGQYRLIIQSAGYEHIVSKAWLQWLSEPTSGDDSVVVVASVELHAIDDGGWQLYSPRIVMNLSKWQVTIDGANTHTEPMSKTRWRITPGEPGKFTVANEYPAP